MHYAKVVASNIIFIYDLINSTVSMKMIAFWDIAPYSLLAVD
jgi:hypothetical protein